MKLKAMDLNVLYKTLDTPTEKYMKFIIMTFLILTSAFAHANQCRSFTTRALQSDCISARAKNPNDNLLYVCRHFGTRGLQAECLQAVETNLDVQYDQLVSCLDYRTRGLQEECLDELDNTFF